MEVVPGNANEMKVKAIYSDHAEIIEIQAHGSTTGFEGLIAKKCDIAMSSRRIKTIEIEQLKTFGDMTAITNEHIIALDGIAVIVNKSNPLHTETNPSRPIVRDFVGYTLSRAGQTIVKDLGFVDLNIKSFVADAIDPAGRKNDGLIRQYAETIKDSDRLSVNFRFKNNQAELDNRGMRDLDRMIDYLKEAMGKKIILVGFADDSGAYEYNRVLALERAETVATDLRTRGIVSTEIHHISSFAEVSSIASDLKKRAKDTKGSVIVRDRRVAEAVKRKDRL